MSTTKASKKPNDTELSPEKQEEFLSLLTSKTDKQIMASVLSMYREKGYSIKYRTQWKAKNDVSPDAYRIFCSIGKSKESLILNTCSYDEAAFMLQLKIRNLSSLLQLDRLSENIRSQILNAKRDCKNCGCPEKAYVFTYSGTTYRKCHMLCDNFRLFHFTEEDVESVLFLIKNELFN